MSTDFGLRAEELLRPGENLGENKVHASWVQTTVIIFLAQVRF